MKKRFSHLFTFLLFMSVICGTIFMLTTLAITSHAEEIQVTVREDLKYDNTILVCFEPGAVDIDAKFTPEDFPLLEIESVDNLTVLTNEEILSDKDFMENYSTIIAIHLSKSVEEIDMNEEIEKVIDCSRFPIKCIEPNYSLNYNACSVPDDPQYSTDQSDILQLIDIEQAWTLSIGDRNIKIGVMDTTIAQHPDLIDNLGSLFDAYAYRTGYHLTWRKDHGTQVAGIIGAVGDNNTNIAGLCWNTTIIPINIFYGYSNPSFSYEPIDFVTAITYLNNNGIYFLNVSLATTDYSDMEEKAINDYYGIVIAGAGNNASELSEDYMVYPACYDCDNIISVGATELVNNEEVLWDNPNDDQGTNYSNEYVDVFAPTGIMSLTYKNQAYDTEPLSGTSGAAPVVTGIAALVKCRNNALTPREVKEIILASVDELNILSGKCVTGGRVNAFGAVFGAIDLLSSNHTPLSLAGDIDGDDYDDIIQYRQSTGKREIITLLNKWNYFAKIPLVTRSNINYKETDEAVAGDFNNDGYSDLVVLSTNDNGWRNYTLYKGGLDVNLEPKLSEDTFVQTDALYSTTSFEESCHVLDFNGDGYDDFVISYTRSGNKKLSNYIFYGGASNMFVSRRNVNSTISNSSADKKTVFSGDVNDDGYDDVVIVLSNSTTVKVNVYEGAASSPLSSVSTQTIYTSTNSDRDFGLNDINGDGYLDLVVYYNGINSVLTFKSFLGLGDGTFGSPTTVSTNLDYSDIDNLFFMDYNGDGRTDVLVHSDDIMSTYYKFTSTSNGLASTYTYRAIDRPRNNYKYTIGDFCSQYSGSELCMEYDLGSSVFERYERAVVICVANNPPVVELARVTTFIPLQMVEW